MTSKKERSRPAYSDTGRISHYRRSPDRLSMVDRSAIVPLSLGDRVARHIETIEFTAEYPISVFGIVQQGVGENRLRRAYRVETGNLLGREFDVRRGQIALQLPYGARPDDRQGSLGSDPGDCDLARAH